MVLKKNKKGAELPLNAIVIAALVIIVMLVIILFFTGGIGQAQNDLDNAGSCNSANPTIMNAEQYSEVKYVDEGTCDAPAHKVISTVLPITKDKDGNDLAKSKVCCGTLKK